MTEKYYVSPILESIRQGSISEDLAAAHKIAENYLDTVNDRPVYPDEEAIAGLEVFEQSMPEGPTETAAILKTLADYGAKGTVAQAGGRYFGFVVGGTIPSALCSKWIGDAWDQNSALYVMSPLASKLEDVCEKWLVSLLGLPEGTAAGFVSGSSTAIMCGLLAARNYLLERQGCNAAAKGLFGMPPIKVVVGEGAHSTVFKALSILGIGYANVTKVPMDEQGRIKADLVPEMDDNTLLILQAGNVNSGSFDDFQSLCTKANKAGAWVHIDGAFGLWAAADPKMSALTKGIELADSWSLDAHKTLNAPYDCGIVLCRRREAIVNALHMTGDYIVLSENRDNMLYTPEMSRRAHAIDLWATFMGLGTQGVAELVEELHAKAQYFADRLAENGFEILNDVVYNQVLVYYKSDELTESIIKKVQASGVCWFGGSQWDGKSVIRISVCSYKTTYEDIDMCVEEMVSCR